MSAFIGMDVDQVDQLSKDLRAQALRIDEISSRIDGLVRRTASVWRGRDAERFAEWWSSQHRPALRSAHDAIEGLAQSAGTNAVEQRRASGISSVDVNRGPTYIEISTRGNNGPIDYGLLAGAGAKWDANASWSASSSGLAGDASLTAKAGLWGDGHVGFTNGPISAEANATYFAGVLAEGGAHGRVGPDGLDAGVNGQVLAGLRSSIDGSVSAGPVGLSARVDGLAGAEANAGATGYVGADGVAASYHAGAFAGARADGSVTQDFFGVKSTVHAGVNAGAGAGVGSDISLTYDRVNLGIDGGIAAGFGGSLGYSIEFKPREMVEGIHDVGDGVTNNVTKFVKSRWPFD